MTRDLGATWEPLPQLDDMRPYRMNCASGKLWLIDAVKDVYRYDIDEESMMIVDYAQVLTLGSPGITSSVTVGDRLYVCGVLDEDSTAVLEVGQDAQVRRLPDAPHRLQQSPMLGSDGSGRLWIASDGLALMSAQQDAWETVWPPD